MNRFDSYATKYSCIRMRRENGILEMRFHTDDGPLRWGLVPHGELAEIPPCNPDVPRRRAQPQRVRGQSLHCHSG
ncbi:MAG TPA: hypothetical protein VD994_02735 [Prosthecobacter sp.]|nr:hypothetical protein [Prosthecobacter sp.]